MYFRNTQTIKCQKNIQKIGQVSFLDDRSTYYVQQSSFPKLFIVPEFKFYLTIITEILLRKK